MGLPAANVANATDFTASSLLQLPVSYPMTSVSFGNSSLETIIGTFNIPGGVITAPGQGYQFKIACSCTATGSPTLTVRMRVVTAAGTIIASGANTVSAAGSWFMFDGWMKFTAVGAGGAFGSFISVQENFSGTAGPGTANGPYSTNGTAWNTTVGNVVFVTAQFSVANAANMAAGVTGDAYQL